MPQTFDPLVIAQMALGSCTDIAFAFVLGAMLMGSLGVPQRRVVPAALVAWLISQGLYLPLQAGTMSGAPLGEALPAIPLVIMHSHFGLMWVIGVVAGIVALSAAVAAPQAPAGRMTRATVLAVALVVIALTHAGTTHAADAGDFSGPELVHTVHLLATACWAGVVITAAWPLRRIFLEATPANAVAYTGRLSNVAALSFLVAIGTGIANAYRGLGGMLMPMTTSPWGQLLSVKVLVVICVVAIGAINRLVYMTRVRAGDPLALRSFMRLLTMEAALMIVVEVVAAVLGHSIPATTG
jgi:putative copper resistance protein D